MARADASGAQIAVILGDDELDIGNAALKVLATAEQRYVALDRFVEELLAA